MSDLATMARPYCERLAACSERFHFGPIPLSGWGIVDKFGESISHARGYSVTAADFWNFFGPLADEFKVQPSNVSVGRDDPREWAKNTLLESIMSAVCEAVERQAKEKA